MINALSADWHIGVKLWKVLGDELCKKVVDKRHEHLPLPSRGDSKPSQVTQGVNAKPIDGPSHGNQDIVRKPQSQPSSTNQTVTDVADMIQHEDQDEEEAVESFLNFVSRIHMATMTFNAMAHTNYWAMLVNFAMLHLCIPDGGADSHAGGKHGSH